MVPGYFLKGDLLRLLGEINGSLRVHNLGADMYLYGGAGLVLGTTFRESTMDLDFHVPQKDIVPFIESVMIQQGKTHGISRYGLKWYDINRFDLGAFIQERDKHFTRLRYGASPIALRVFTLNPEPQLALKLARRRTKGRDVEDMVSLCGVLRIRKIEDLKAVWDKYTPLMREGQAAEMMPYDMERKWMEISLIRRERALTAI